MSVVIRMKRTGRKHRACYRISVADSRKPRDGRTIENLGTYDPQSPVEGLRVKLNVERAQHWLTVGALPSETVHTLFTQQGVYGEAKPAPTKRDRSGRKNKTARGAKRGARQANSIAAKAVRREKRVEEKAAAKAAAAEKSDE